MTVRENGLNPFEYLEWIFTNAPNLGKPGYASTIEDFLPGSAALPQKVVYAEAKGNKARKICLGGRLMNFKSTRYL